MPEDERTGLSQLRKARSFEQNKQRGLQLGLTALIC